MDNEEDNQADDRSDDNDDHQPHVIEVSAMRLKKQSRALEKKTQNKTKSIKD